MALPATLYRFRVDLSDVDRGLYESLEVRMAQHPSESVPFMLTRLLAYLLRYQEGIAFSKEGLCNPEDPALFVDDLTGVRKIWIEVGLPGAERLHKASKAADKVLVFAHKNPEGWLQGIRGNTNIYKREEIEVFAPEESLLKELGAHLKRNNPLEVTHTEGELYITLGGESMHGHILAHRLL